MKFDPRGSPGHFQIEQQGVRSLDLDLEYAGHIGGDGHFDRDAGRGIEEEVVAVDVDLGVDV
jgi:hypothetical protein